MQSHVGVLYVLTHCIILYTFYVTELLYKNKKQVAKWEINIKHIHIIRMSYEREMRPLKKNFKCDIKSWKLNTQTAVA